MKGNDVALVDLWEKDRAQLAGKHIQQVMAFAGDGKLLDGSVACSELRAFFRNLPSDCLATYVEQCLQGSFDNSGLVLQDLVNEIGRRLDFEVIPGRYRGTSAHLGHDGIWTDKNRHSIIVEVKTTDAYRIDLNTIAGYRQSLAKLAEIDLEKSSMLVVVGRQDTGDLEAQIRGSRHAWDMRVISVGALFRMLKLKEEVEDPSILTRIHEILIPREFTRLDAIVEIAFAVVEEVKQVVETAEAEAEEDGDNEEKRNSPVSFHAECVARIEHHLHTSLVKNSRASFSSSDSKTGVVCSISRFHEKNKIYWFAFHPHQAQFLSTREQGCVAFGCGDAGTLFLIPFSDFRPWLDYCNKTERADHTYWHVKIRKSPKGYVMTGRAGMKDFDITQYKV
jgi:hypothetical protein